MKFLSALSLMLIAGCSVSTNDNGKPTRVSQYSYDPALCTSLLPETGNKAHYENLRVSRPVESAYFSKRYNRATLEGVLAASGIDTQIFVTAMGIELSKIPFVGEKNTCLFQHALPVAPDFLMREWDESAGGDLGGGHLDGLFVAYRASSQLHEAIMVREDSSRWTLVHEMMHANFFRQRQADGLRSGRALKDAVTIAYARLDADYDEYKRTQSATSLDRVVNDSDALAQLLYQALVAGSLEEIADESLLLQEWADGRLKFVSTTSVKNAAWYIDYSRTLTLQDLNSYAGVVMTMRDQIGAPALGRFDSTLDFITSVNAKTDALAEKARENVRKLIDADGVSLVLAAPDRSHVEAQSNTPAMIEFRKKTAAFLK